MNRQSGPGAGFAWQMRLKMADKQIVFSDQEQMQIQAIVIDKDKEEALKWVARLVEAFKGHAGHACSPGPIR